MNSAPDPDYTERLRSLMQQRGITSFKALSQIAGVSEWQVTQLRRGQASQMRVAPLHQLSQALQISLAELLTTFTTLTITPNHPVISPGFEQLQQEYQRLQTQLDQQREQLQQEFQRSSLQLIESWLIQFPTAACAAQQNSDIPAIRILPLLRPLEQLLKAWNVEAIAPVGAEIPYDPQHHQLMEGTAQPGDQVKVRYTGYYQGEKLLYRAKVSLVHSAE